MADDLMELVLGKELGVGYTRRVYVNKLNPFQVIKYEDDPTKLGQNTMEYQIWNRAQNEPNVKKWLAPCFHISPGGKYLVQARVKPVRMQDMPRKVPAWMGDLKISNFGRYKGRIVCCDYGILIGMLLAQATTRMKVADWWHADEDETPCPFDAS